MDADTLLKITNHITRDRAKQLIPGLLQAFRIADVNTVDRRAMFLAQCVEESDGLRTTREYGTGWEYEGRADLGNTRRGDGPLFKGRGFIQLTGRYNYGKFSQWCFDRDLVPNNHYFIDHPNLVETEPWDWISAAYYWMGYHDHGYDYLNKAADAKDIVAATYMVNGGQNGIDTRRYYYGRAIALGKELLSEYKPGPNDPNWSDMATKKEIQDMIDASIKKNDNKDADLMEGMIRNALVFYDTGTAQGERWTMKAHPNIGNGELRHTIEALKKKVGLR